MLDIKFIINNSEKVRQNILNRGYSAENVDEIIDLHHRRNRILSEVEEERSYRNRVSEEINRLKQEKKPVDEIIIQMREVSKRIKLKEESLREIEDKLMKLLLTIPNMLHESVKIGKSNKDNVEVYSWGRIREKNFPSLPHWEIAQKLDLIDFKCASKLSGPNFALYKGLGAKLERALINFMLDIHTKEQNYIEISPPFIVNRKCMVGTGQLPKLEEDMYRCEEDDLFLIPTAEVPLTNIHREEILDGDSLPIYYTAYTPCFRREAGSYGKETKGLIRVHQFDKVEIVKFTKPEKSYEELETLLQDAVEILKRLDLHFRVVSLCSGEVGFSASKCYDVEVWADGIKKYLEVSSCSNFEDFQARRANIKFRPSPTEKPIFVHTLNGSGVALPRLMIALIENYQQEDGSILIPEALQKYMDGIEKIPPS